MSCPRIGLKGAQPFAELVAPAFEEAQTNGMAKLWRVSNRGHPALIVAHIFGIALHKKVRASSQDHVPVNRAQTNKLQAIFALLFGTVEKGSSDKIFLARDHISQPDHPRIGLPVQLVARNMAL